MKKRILPLVFLILPLVFSFKSLGVMEYQVPVSPLEIYLYSLSDTELDGETQNSHFVDKKALELTNLDFSTSNSVYFNSPSGNGLAAGKASGNVLRFTTRASKAIPVLYKFLCVGSHFGTITIELGSSLGGTSFVNKEKIELKLALVSNVSVRIGDSFPGEVLYDVELHFGAIKRTIYEQTSGGGTTNSETSWSYILNNDSFDIK